MATSDVLLPWQPVIYYGDEQGSPARVVIKWPADDVRQQVPEYWTTIARYDRTQRSTTSTPTISCIGSSPTWQPHEAHPALRNGAHQHRYATDGAGIYAFSRLHRGEQREYVVGQQHESNRCSSPHLCPQRQLREGVRSGPKSYLEWEPGLTLTVPALSAVVYESAADSAIRSARDLARHPTVSGRRTHGCCVSQR